MNTLFDTLHIPFVMSPLFIFGIVLFAGVTGAYVARLFHIPSLTGNILAGVLIGPSALHVISNTNDLNALQPLSVFAMGLIAVNIGGHLSYRRIHNAIKRILFISLFEVITAFLFVTFALQLCGAPWPMAPLLGAIAIATAPATTIALIRETRSKGTFVKTLLSVVALNNIFCLVLFAIIRPAAGYFSDPSNATLSYLYPIWLIVAPILIGILIAKCVEQLISFVHLHHFSTVFIAILFCTGISSFLGLSPLLTCLFFGITLGNSSLSSEGQLSALEPLEQIIYVCFFTLAGASLHVEALAGASVLCVVYLLTRAGGKYLGAIAGGILGGSSRRIWHNIPLGLFPQAGVAVGLVVLLQTDRTIPYDIVVQVEAIVLAAVMVSEIIGPFFTKMALKRSRETDKDRPRLIEFLQEEFIYPHLRAKDKWEAVHTLSDFLVRTHRAEHLDRDTIYASFVERMKSQSYAVGNGVAIIHGYTDSGPAIQGVLGICPEGIDFGAPDGIPVKLITQIITPREHEMQHLPIVAKLAAMKNDEVIRTRLIAAHNANEAWEIIEDEETPTYNYFLE